MLLVQRLDRNAILPTRAHPDDAGADLYSLEEITIEPGRVAKARTGIAISLPTGCYGRIAPRSGRAANDGIDVLGGVIDRGYTGELLVLLTKVTPGSITLSKGSKMAQLIIERCETYPIVEVAGFENSERGAAGFGSTG